MFSYEKCYNEKIATDELSIGSHIKCANILQNAIMVLILNFSGSPVVQSSPIQSSDCIQPSQTYIATAVNDA